MEMDLQLSLIAIGVACATAVAVYFVSVIGIREKSFEEAIAEQKKRSDDLLGHTHHKKDKKKVSNKDKVASKKLKKREKQNNNVASDASDVGEVVAVTEDQEVPEVPKKHEKKCHVEIVDEPEILEDEEEEQEVEEKGIVAPRASSRRSSVSAAPGSRRDSIIKPILLNKDESPVVSSKHEVEPANHFEQIHPKDDCELKKERSTENMLENLSSPPSPRIGSKSSGSNTPVDEVNTTDSPNVSKRSRGNKHANRKNEDEANMTAPKIEKIIDRLALTSSEIQNLIDVLLNKQHAGDSEWVKNTKGGNSVSDLKKQLDLKDKLLEEEKGTVRTLQDKLKEVRNEFGADKSKFAGVRRTLEEQVQARNLEVQNLQIRLRQVGEIGMSEKGELQKQLQRMQVKFKDVQDEYEAIKADYRNYRDAEQTIRSKADTLERESGALKTQCGHLENQLKNAFATNQDMTNQMRSLQEHLRATEERNKEKELVMSAEYRKLQEREAVLITELSSLKNKLTSVETENAQLRNNVSALEGNVKTLEEVNGKYEEVRKSEVSLKNIVNELKSSLTTVNEVLSEKDQRVVELEEIVCSLTGQVKELESGRVNGEVKGIEVESLKREVEGLHGRVGELQAEVDAVRGKNDELRGKNTKLVDSLNVTEKSLEAKIRDIEGVKIQREEERGRVEGIVRGICGGEVDLSSQDWLVSLLTRVQNTVTELKNRPEPVQNGPSEQDVEKEKQRSKQLEDEVTHYQAMLKETETLLSNLQASINDEEAKWVTQTAEKDREIERLKSASSAIEQLQQKCQQLEDASSSNDTLEIDQLRDTNTSLRVSLEAATSRITELESKLSSVESTPSSSTNPNSHVPQNGSVTSNGSSSTQETLNPVTSNNNKNATTPPSSPQQAAPPSPSTISTASSSPPVSKEKKKKKGSSKKQ